MHLTGASSLRGSFNRFDDLFPAGVSHDALPGHPVAASTHRADGRLWIFLGVPAIHEHRRRAPESSDFCILCIGDQHTVGHLLEDGGEASAFGIECGKLKVKG